MVGSSFWVDVCIVLRDYLNFCEWNMSVGPQCAALHAIQILDCRYQFWGAKQSTKLGFFPTLFAICRSCQKRQKSEAASKNWCRQARKPTIIIMIITRFVVLFRPLYCGWKDGLQLHWTFFIHIVCHDQFSRDINPKQDGVKSM